MLANSAPSRTAWPLIITDSLHVPLSLVPSSHHSLPRCPTPLFPLSSYKPCFLLCLIRIVHRQLWRCPRSLFIHCHSTSSPGLLVSPKYLVSYSTVFHDPHCTGFFCITARYLLPRVYHVYVFVNSPSSRTILLCFPPILCLPLHFPTRTTRLRSTSGGVCNVYKARIWLDTMSKYHSVILAYPPVRFCKLSVRS